MIYVLFDNPSKIAFVTDAITEPYEVMNIGGRKGPFLMKVFSCCKDTAGRVKDGDVIVCWLDLMGVLCWHLCKRKKVRIVAINILLKEKATLKNRIYRRLYRSALKDKNLVATVTAPEYGKYLNSFLGIDREYELLHDAYNPEKWLQGIEEPVEPGTVFCGGRNGRDWAKVIEIAKAMPDVKFNLVMPGEVYQEFKGELDVLKNQNVRLSVDVKRGDFAKVLASSELVAMPLDSQSPSGLLVFYEATAKGKMIITSDTVTTREYFSDGRGALCSEAVSKWTETIRFYLDNADKAKECNEKLNSFLMEKCSVGQFQHKLADIISK